jgi:hypothetical protein
MALAPFDDFMQKINDGTILNDSLFEMYDFDDEGVVSKEHNVVHGYLSITGISLGQQRFLQSRQQTNRARVVFSAWLESMRKDVECTFGILKGRWQILKSGNRLLGAECDDDIFLTCFALHNWLLEVGVLSVCEGAIGEVPGVVLSSHDCAGGAPVGDAGTTNTTMMGGDRSVLRDAISVSTIKWHNVPTLKIMSLLLLLIMNWRRQRNQHTEMKKAHQYQGLWVASMLIGI